MTFEDLFKKKNIYYNKNDNCDNCDYLRKLFHDRIYFFFFFELLLFKLNSFSNKGINS